MAKILLLFINALVSSMLNDFALFMSIKKKKKKKNALFTSLTVIRVEGVDGQCIQLH